MRFDVVIVGAGHGGAQTAVQLRQQGFAGTIALVGDEPDLPYERPALSKDYLAGAKSFERILLRPPDFWDQRAIAVMPGRRVDAVDPADHSVTATTGETIGYGTLVWSTGGAPRRLTCTGAALDGVHMIRTRADVDRLTGELPRVARAVVIGGGYVGLEAAAALIKLGKRVVLLEALPRVLARVAGEAMSAFYEAEHRAHGVDLRTGVAVDCLVGDGGRVTGVRLSDGEEVPADLVVVGIGIVPSVEPLRAAGAAGGNGVDVDAQCRTTLPDIFAIGDCAAHANAFADGMRIRLESIQNANDMAAVVAKTITGQVASYEAVPWFWSNQYDLKLQTVGLSTGYDAAVVRGDPAARRFSVVYLKQGRVIALDCVGAVKDYVQGRALVVGRATPDPALLADASVPLAALA